jgi:diguanylate cyclase (GGDEF)-like protein
MTRWAAKHCRCRQGTLNVRLPVGKAVRKNKKMILCSSLLIVIVELIFLYITYSELRNFMFLTLLQQAKRHQDEFTLNLKMAYNSMLQMSTLITSNSDLTKVLLKEQIQPAGSANKPEKNREQNKPKNPPFQKTYQFGSVESSPYLLSKDRHAYSWLRGVSPVWAVNPGTNEKVYVGAVEISTTFKDIVRLYGKLFRVDAAVLLNKEHVRNRMWNDETKKYFENHPNANHYVEVTTSSSSTLAEMLSHVFIKSDYKTDNVTIVYHDHSFYSLYYFPLPENDDQEPNAELPGFMLIWEDVYDQVFQYGKFFAIAVGLALLAFLLIESGLIWLLNRETRLSAAEQCAAVDELTGLFNRRYFDDLLENELHRTIQSQDAPLSLIVCDVDYFKRYNDTYGHKAGDECLQQIADTLRRQARRSSDCVARYGGEEFVIVLPRTDIHAAIDIAETARKAVLGLSIPHASSSIVPVVTVTLGVACTNQLAEYDNLFEAADRNLYIAKNNGRNRVEPLKRDGLKNMAI